ncbi:MAG: SCO family protein [Desulfuromonadales bacterium]|jgi:protein SCO1/2|nr:SCO family protein [Desulfuromonadales bacterium]
MKYIIPLLLFVCCLNPAFAADNLLSLSSADEDPTDWLQEKLGANLPLDVEFVNSAGQTVILGDLIDRPTLVVPVYYNCRNVCNYLLGGLAKVLPDIKLDAGEAYRVITISFDESESPELAAKSKQTFMSAMQGKFPPEAWDFLTGRDVDIRKVTDAAGYYYRKEGVDFLHPIAAFVVTKDGRIVRYLSGYRFLPLDLTMALVEASEDRIGIPIRKALEFCFSYDPEGRRYVFNLLRVSGTVILLTLGSFLTYLIISGRKKRS